MSSASDYVKRLLSSQLDVYQEIELFLRKIVGHRQGSEWAFEQVENINLQFDKVKKLEREINGILKINPEFAHRIELVDIVNKIKNAILKIKRFMDILQIRVAGGQRVVFENLKNIIKRMDIEGYRQKNALNKISVDCLY